MNQLVSDIVKHIETRMKGVARTLPGVDSTLRTVFHGPHLGILGAVLDRLSLDGGVTLTLGDGTSVSVPVVLPVERTEGVTENPAVGDSGLCDPSHLLSLRNTPSCPRFLALVSPARHSILSIAQATDEFGLSSDNNSGSASVEEWWSDEFVQSLVDSALDRHNWHDDVERSNARLLLQQAVVAADEGDRHDAQRHHCWAALARVLSTTGPVAAPGNWWSLACGFPPVSSGRIDAKEQGRVLGALMMAVVEEGYASCAARLKRVASDTEQVAIDECLDHLQRGCEVPLALLRAASFYYAPSRRDTVDAPPRWWETLTTERLAELLEQEVSEQPGELKIHCENALIPAGRGLPYVVDHELALSITTPSDALVDANIVREAGSQANRREWPIPFSSRADLADEAVPKHKAPVRYTATAPGMKKASLRVVSLASWELGIVVTSRTATKVKLPARKPRTGKHTLECEIVLAGEGRHLLDLYTTPGITLQEHVSGEDNSTNGADPLMGTVSVAPPGSGGPSGLELEATSDCHYDLRFTRADGASEHLRLLVSCDEAPVEGCRSEFERLIRLNRQPRVLDVQADHQTRAADLQSWMLAPSVVAQSFYPLVLSRDCRERWHAPNWLIAEDTIISRGRFLHDPRPTREEMLAPAEFVEARSAIAARVRGDDEQGLVEVAQLGTWMQEAEFSSQVEAYVRAYLRWLEEEPTVAAWADLVLVCGLEVDGRTLAQEPDAVLVSPLHPLRVGWHCLAQRALRETWQSSNPCPASSILDPDSLPDTLALPLRTPTGGLRYVTMLATECSSDYWSVLWNGTRIERLAVVADTPPFDEELGIRLGGLSSGFSVSQVRRSLDDVATLMTAKPVLNVAVANHGGRSDACNDGLMTWARDRFTRTDTSPLLTLFGTRQLQVFDERRPEVRPEDASVANLTEDTAGAVRWYSRVPDGAKPDLGIIAQLETSNAAAEETQLGSPLGFGALMRHRVRMQLKAGGGAFLSESRTGVEGPPTGDGLADAVMRGVARLENLDTTRRGYTFAPSVQSIQSMFDQRSAEYVAVSSSSVDPACFVGGWLDSAYLWDYELPSYSHRAGDTNGYYLLSRVKPIERDSLQALLARLPGCESVDEERLQGILLEVARRGIPTVRGLSAGHSGATGDLGLFLAGRLLQDDFRAVAHGEKSLLRVHSGGAEGQEVSLVVPVDPFRGYLGDLQRSLGIGEFQRPDLLVASITVSDSAVRCRVTPVEVKYRREDTMTPAGSREALDQARALSRLFRNLSEKGGANGLVMWRLTYQHLLLSMLDFGFRVYSQHPAVLNRPTEWSGLHYRVTTAILADEACVEIDPIGRLVIFDATASSGPRDVDGDGFKETIVVAAPDAGQIACGNPGVLYTAIRNAVGDWNLRPEQYTAAVAVENQPVQGDEVFSEHSAAPVEVRAHESAPDILPGIAPVPPLSIPVPAAPVTIETDHGVSKPATRTPLETHHDGIRVHVGESLDSFTNPTLLLRPSLTALNQLNMGVVGDLGTGKTQLVKSLVYQLTRSAADNDGVRPRFLIFDYKRDYSAPDFVNAVNARVVTPHELPLNLFDISGASEGAAPWLGRFKFFADVLDKIYSNVGPVQRENLKQAVREAYQSAGSMGRQPTIYDVYDRYRAQVQGKPDAPLSIIGDMIDMELFVRDPSKAVPFDGFLDGVVVLSLDALGQDDRTKNMLVAIMLNMFYEHMLRIPKRPYRGAEPQLRTIDSYLLVDEADNIMRYEFDVLRKILLQGREFGVGVILASQYLRHFKAGATDYREPLLSWFIHKVPNVTAQELAALGLPSTTTQPLVDRIRQLGNHECLFKTFDVSGEIVAGMPFYSLLAGDPTS
ncbi:hypothetical protein [Longimicrobium sp.]|uniref:hypothetical protein n=1 Tax=Longimicrobium sp. TaxID=2029185 RepID=UPI002E36A6AC|nr:hypothetical protein [Longimicrobium sp.]HEX6038280.1 hypothetical protein [Longimicrobium sp.]